MPIEIKITDVANLTPEELYPFLEYLQNTVRTLSVDEPTCETRSDDESTNPDSHLTNDQLERAFKAGSESPSVEPLTNEQLQGVFNPLAPAPMVAMSPPVFLEHDSQGLPWDSRVHAANKSKSVKGEWRKKPGVDKLIYECVMKELRIAANPSSKEVPNHVMSTRTTHVNRIDIPEVETITFEKICSFVTQLITKNTVSPKEILDTLHFHGLNKLPDLAALPEQIPTLWRAFNELAEQKQMGE